MQKIVSIAQVRSLADTLDPAIISYIEDGQIETFESFPGYDLVAFDWYDPQNLDALPAQILLFIDRENLVCICENEIALRVAESLFVMDPSNERAFSLFFKNLFRGGAKHLEQIENRISELDDAVGNGTGAGLRERLIDMRNETLRAHAYYEQLSFLLEEICDNDNSLLSPDNLKYFEVLKSRSVRLVAQTVALREYITQVRESYQAEIGIEQNNLMKVFTIVTSIFLPLSLIVGWYGMNLRMPEFGWEHGYPFVIGLCLAIGAIWFFVCKKKKWF